MAPVDRGLGDPLPTVPGGGGDWGPPGLQLGRGLWTTTVELDIMGGVERPEGEAVYCGRRGG